jgi:glycogen debranching enzyme
MTTSPGSSDLPPVLSFAGPNAVSQAAGNNEQADLYVLQQSAKASIRTVALKRDNTFLVADVRGDLLVPQQEMGLFWHDTRYLNIMDLRLGEQPLMGLSHSVAENGEICQFDLCNPFLQLNGEDIPQGTIHVHRTIELHEQEMIQHITLASYHPRALRVTFSVRAAADFSDIFEIRGLERGERGQMLAPVRQPTVLTFRYQGRDGCVRRSEIAVSPPADAATAQGLAWELDLLPGQLMQMQIDITLHEAAEPHDSMPHDAPRTGITVAMPEISGNNVFFNRLLTRGMHDLGMMCAQTAEGLYPYGGIPWYVCPFGRDGLITSLEFLPWFPDVARGTLAFLAHYQGKKLDEFTEEEPGRILHEFRHGEMAKCREVPFTPYYGTIDATPLFLITLESYVRWTNDLDFLRQLWPHAQAAAEWMIQYGDRDGDTFLEYDRKTEKGLINQGWKDSWDAVSHANGELAEAPIALCEVQGYAYAAYEAMRYLANRLHLPDDAAQWHAHAERLYANFWRSFWWEEEQTLYLALDRDKQPCQVVTSNAGQCLWTGIVPPRYAEPIIQRLRREDMYSEWGVRTLSARAVRYNPMSYHNGSVWPHDTALVGAGFARYGHKNEAGKLLENLFALSLHYERARLPELLCGFPRRQGFGPTYYPVACAPQSWAAGAPFLLLSALLGLQPDAEQGRLIVHKPHLPEFLNELEIKHVHLGGAQVGLHCLRARSGAITVTSAGPVDLHVIART